MRIRDWSSDVCSSDLIDTFEAIALITQQATKGDLKKLGFAFEDMQAQGAIRSLIQNLDEYRRVRDESLKAKGTVSGAFDTRMLRSEEHTSELQSLMRISYAVFCLKKKKITHKKKLTNNTLSQEKRRLNVHVK